MGGDRVTSAWEETFKVSSCRRDECSHGTGVAIRYCGRVFYVTAGHVLDGDGCMVTTLGLQLRCRVVWVAEGEDIGVVEVSERGVFRGLPLDVEPEFGEDVRIVGYAGVSTVPMIIRAVYTPVLGCGGRRVIAGMVPAGFSGAPVVGRRGVIGLVQSVAWEDSPPAAFTIFLPSWEIARVLRPLC